MYSNEIDRTRSQKLYSQLFEILKGQIGKDGWTVGTQIPTEEQLCSQYSVSKATVRLALAELVSMGFLKKIQGKGTFVRRRKPDNSIPMLTKIDDADLFYDSPNIVRVIENKTFKPPEEIGDCLQLSEDDHCFFLSRLVIANSGPLLIQNLYVPYGLLPGPVTAEEMAPMSAYCFLESRCGAKIRRMTETTCLTKINGREADLLELSSDSHALKLKQVCFANGDTPISLSESLFRADGDARTVEFERLRS